MDQECPFGRYDLTVGTSERGEALGFGRLPKFQWGHPRPLEAAKGTAPTVGKTRD